MARILYIIVWMILIVMLFPITYAVFQLLILFFGSCYDDLTGTNDFFMWTFS